MDTAKSSTSEENLNFPKYPKLKDADEANLVWDEYKYRHDLIWQHLIRSTLALVALLTVPYSKALNLNDSLIRFAGVVALGYWVVTVIAIEPELRLLKKIKNLHRERQKHYFDLDNDIKWINEKMWWGKIFFVDHFAGRVGVYLLLLLLATLLALRVALL